MTTVIDALDVCAIASTLRNLRKASKKLNRQLRNLKKILLRKAKK